MDLSLFGKFENIFKYIFSSFLSIEMFMLSLLLFLILTINLKRNNYMIQMIAIGVYVGFIIGILISYTTYVKSCIHSFVKLIMNYIYFPSTVIYFFIILFVTVMSLYTVFSKKLSFFKKVFNYSVFSLLYFFFMSFIALATYDNVDLLDINKLYSNDTILSFVQISNFLLVVWLIFTGFYNLYWYLKKKFN